MGGLGGVLFSVYSQTKQGFLSLRGSPRDLYLVFVLKILDSYNYFALSVIFTIYLTEEFGISDYKAGALYGLWGTLLTLYGIFLSGFIDLFGVRTSLVLCFTLQLGSRLVVASTQSETVMLCTLLGPMTIAGALGVPVMTIGIKRYTTVANRGFAFSLFYAFMNVAAFGVGMVMDVFTITLKNGFGIPGMAPHHLLSSGNRLFVASGCIGSAVGIIVSLQLKESFISSTPMPDTNEANEKEPVLPHPHARSAPAGDAARAAPTVPLFWGACGLDWVQRTAVAGWRSVKELVVMREVQKFLFMCLITINLKQIFRHLDATLPKYEKRKFGCKYPVGAVYGINPFMIIGLVPIVGAMTTDYSHFDMIHYGSYISSVSPFAMVVVEAAWSPVIFILLLSLGEAVWSPRWYDYSMSVAPEGREGLFTALASAPLFVAKLPTGMLSGALLQRFCPGNGACDSPDTPPLDPAACNGRIMWLVIGLLTLSSPLLILATQRWVRPREDGIGGPGTAGGDGGGCERNYMPMSDPDDPHPAPPVVLVGPPGAREGSGQLIVPRGTQPGMELVVGGQGEEYGRMV